MKRRFWTYYLSIVVFVLGGVYMATANLDSVPLQLSSAEMQQLMGAYEENAHCASTDGCSVIACWSSPARIRTVSRTVLRCFDGNTWCSDDEPPGIAVSCIAWGYNNLCDVQLWGPLETRTYGCADGE